MATIHELAEQLAKAFIRKERDNGDEFVCLVDGSPAWMHDVTQSAHGDMFPDDHRYQMVKDAALWLAEETNDPDDNPDDFADNVNVYTADLLRWLSSNLARVDYVNDAMDGCGERDLAQIIMLAQSIERQEVLSIVAAELEKLAE